MPGFNSNVSTLPLPQEFFSYDFAWWLDGHRNVTSEELSQDLVAYYQGLMSWCYEALGEPNPACSLSDFTAKFVEIAAGPDGSKSFTGKVTLFDAWYNNAPMTLNFVTNTYYCRSSGHQAVLSSASPEPLPGDRAATKESNEVWAQLLERQAAFTCE